MRQARPCVRAVSELVAPLLSKTTPAYEHGATQRQAKLSSHFTIRTSHFSLPLHASSRPFALTCHLSRFFSSVLTLYFPEVPCATKLAANTSQYYFVLQSLHKAIPSTTLHNKVCTKHIPVLLCTTNLAPNTSQYYFVLQSLHKAHPRTTSYFKA